MKRNRPPSPSRLWLLLSVLLAVMLLVNMACAAPAINLPTRTPENTPGTTDATPAFGESRPGVNPPPTGAGDANSHTVPSGGQVNYPPALVEVDPEPLSDLALGDTPVFYFNQPMERASVEAALKVDPAVSGRLEWLDDSTARFVPGQALPPQTELTLTIDASAASRQGQPMVEPVQVAYRTAGPLRLGERLPAPGADEVNPASAVVVTFNAPVVPLGDDPASGPAAFTLTPEVSGQGEWLNTSTYIFYPKPAMLGGAEYTVKLNPELKSADGGPLDAAAPREWTFSTAKPVLLSIEPAPEQPVELDEPFVLTFNQPMDPASVEADFSLLGPKGAKVAGTFNWNETNTKVTFQPENLLERGGSYTVVLFGTARSQGGAVIGQDFAASLSTVPQFGVTQTIPAAGQPLTAYDGYATITLTFASPIAAGQDLSRLLTVTPAIVGQNAYRSFDGYQIYLSGYFLPSASYTLSVSQELQDQWGATLGHPFNFTFISQPANPKLVIPVHQAGASAMFVAYAETSLPAYSTNVTRLALSRGDLTLGEFIQASQNWQGLQNWQGKVDASWARLVYPIRNKTEQIEIPLTQNGDLLTPGLYFLNIETQPAISETVEPPRLVVVSTMHMLLKASASEAFVWAVRLSDNAPASGRVVTVYDQRGQALGSCSTDEAGICKVSFPEREEPSAALFAVMGQPGEPEFSLAELNWSQGISPWDFQMPYSDQGSAPEVYLYTDRPIYRPGQAVHFRAVIRGQNNVQYSIPAMSEMAVEVVSPYDPLTSKSQTLSTQRLSLSPYGTISGVYTLPEDARPGTYTLRPVDAGFQEIYFEVAEYRKPEIDLQVEFNLEDQLVGKDLTAAVNADYFFGAPAGNMTVRWSLFRTVRYPELLEGMSTGPVDTAWLRPERFFGSQEIFVMEGQGQTGPDGSLVIEIDGEDLQERISQEASSSLELTLEVTVEDESGLPVSARASTMLHPAPTFVGVRPEQWVVSAGEQMTFFTRTVDWQGGAVTNQPLHARFRKVVFVQQSPTDPYGPSGFRPEYTDAGSTDFYTSNTGEARLAFTPNEPGTYMIEIKGDDGAIAQHIIWVGGPGSAPWPNLANQHILLSSDQQDYQPGQTAKIFIPNPFSGGAKALVTVERGKVMRSYVVQIEEANLLLDLPLAEEDAPNVYVSVVLLGRTAGRIDFRQGYLELQVSPAANLLNVELLASPKQVQPGEQVAFQMRVTNAQGNPVQGEFSLALVDQAVLALADPNAPSIQDAFYGRQPLGVLTGLAMANYAGRFLNVAEGRGGGGGGGDVGLTTTVRSEFEDTAYWNGTVETDENGVAQVILSLPDNLTTWHVDIRGVTVDTEVGQAQAELVASKPLLVRPVTPRFVVAGDHFQLSAIVHNNTEESLRASVRLESPGFLMDDLNQAAQPVDVPAGGRARVDWWGTVQNVPALNLTFLAEAGELQDAARPERGALPVLRYSTSQTMGTAGVLPEAGEEVEWVNLPRSFTPTGGELTVEINPSLSATILSGLDALRAFPRDFNEPAMSRLLPNLAALRAMQDLRVEDEALRTSLQTSVTESVERLVRSQNEDGGWGWAAGFASDTYVSSYVLFGLSQAQAVASVDPQVLQAAQRYLTGTIFVPTASTDAWALDRLAFQMYALQQSGYTDLDLRALDQLRDKLSPWGKAFLALTIAGQSPDDERVKTIISDLQSSANRSATGAHWQDASPAWHNWSTPNFTTAVVAYAIAQTDPTSAVLGDAARYLAAHRRPTGAWTSSYESAWVLLALVQMAVQTEDTQASYAFSAQLNGSPIMQGQVGEGGSNSQVTAAVPLSGLRDREGNALQIQRGSGSGRMAYRAFLRVDRPAQDAQALQRGLSLTRRYYLTGLDCEQEDCRPVVEADVADPRPLLVRLTLTVPEDMQFVVVEDYLPAGAEVLNPRLKTTQQFFNPSNENVLPYDEQNPFAEGWGWWLFGDPQVRDNRVRWVVDHLPAGTYELTYRITPYLSGEFQVLPARAWQYYFPEVESASEGGVLNIQ